MKIPKKVKIGVYTYIVEYKRKLIDEKGDELWGLCDSSNHIIYLKKGMRQKRKAEVFLHECLHGIEDSYGITLGESKVNRLGLALLAFITDNRLNFNEPRRIKRPNN